MTRGTLVGPWVAMLVLTLSFFLFLLAGIYTLRQSQHVDDVLCQQSVESREAVRSTWLAAEEYILLGQPNEEARARTREFFGAVLSTIPPLRCVDRQPVEVR